jgi:hypothetical protein
MAHGLPAQQLVGAEGLRIGLDRLLDNHPAEDDHARVGMSKIDPATIKGSIT